MKRQKSASVLGAALETGRMVRVLRKGLAEDERIDGFVVGLSDSFVLLHALDGDHMDLNGYVALPVREVASVRTLDEYDRFPERALQVKGIAARPQPDILLVDFSGLLSSADAHFPLVTIHLDRLYPDTCYIGRVGRLTDRSVRLREIDPAGRWDDEPEGRKYRFRDITRIEFGGGYEDALWRVSQAERQTPASL